MYKSIITSIGYAFLLLTFSLSYSTEKTEYYTLISQYPTEYYILATGTVLAIGTLLYHYYQTIAWNYEQIIEDCRLIYKKIYQDIQDYHDFYHHDVQISDWELKETIIGTFQKPYPFMTYYTTLIKNSYRLHNHLALLNTQLIKINKIKKQLRNNPSETTAHLQEIFLLLENKGKQLRKKTIKMITFLVILKNRIKLFKEYNDDCHNWSQTAHTSKA